MRLVLIRPRHPQNAQPPAGPPHPPSSRPKEPAEQSHHSAPPQHGRPSLQAPPVTVPGWPYSPTPQTPLSVRLKPAEVPYLKPSRNPIIPACLIIRRVPRPSRSPEQSAPQPSPRAAAVSMAAPHTLQTPPGSPPSGGESPPPPLPYPSSPSNISASSPGTPPHDQASVESSHDAYL